MNQLKIANAYNTLVKLGNAQLSIPDAYAVFKLRKALEDNNTFYTQKMRDIIMQYNGRFESGTFVFESPEVCQQAKDELDELNNAEADVEFKQAEIELAAIRDGAMTPNDFENLEGFVVFK